MKTVIFINAAGNGAIRSFPELAANALIKNKIVRELTEDELKEYNSKLEEQKKAAEKLKKAAEKKTKKSK